MEVTPTACGRSLCTQIRLRQSYQLLPPASACLDDDLGIWGILTSPRRIDLGVSEEVETKALIAFVL